MFFFFKDITEEDGEEYLLQEESLFSRLSYFSDSETPFQEQTHSHSPETIFDGYTL